MGNQTGVRNGKLYGGRCADVKRRPVRERKRIMNAESKQPLQQIDHACCDPANQEQQQNNPAEHHQLEFSIALLVRRR